MLTELVLALLQMLTNSASLVVELASLVLLLQQRSLVMVLD
jgi:hypothetical protein